MKKLITLVIGLVLAFAVSSGVPAHAAPCPSDLPLCVETTPTPTPTPEPVCTSGHSTHCNH